jgi:hypothetical protein
MHVLDSRKRKSCYTGSQMPFRAPDARPVFGTDNPSLNSWVADRPIRRFSSFLERNKGAVVIEACGGGPRVLSDGARQIKPVSSGVSAKSGGSGYLRSTVLQLRVWQTLLPPRSSDLGSRQTSKTYHAC